jgi:hypothetical protein
MAKPNIVNVTTIFPNTAFLNVTTVSTNVVVNNASSDKVYKINSLVISNYDGANTADITASILRDGVENRLASTIAVPADASLVIISKDISFYLEEGDAIRLAASANNDLWAVCSYEELS